MLMPDQSDMADMVRHGPTNRTRALSFLVAPCQYGSQRHMRSTYSSNYLVSRWPTSDACARRVGRLCKWKTPLQDNSVGKTLGSPSMRGPYCVSPPGVSHIRPKLMSLVFCFVSQMGRCDVCGLYIHCFVSANPLFSTCVACARGLLALLWRHKKRLS